MMNQRATPVATSERTQQSQTGSTAQGYPEHHSQLRLRPNSIYPGDCIQVMTRLPSDSIDFILTDPPYLVNYTDRAGRTVKNDDNDAWLQPAMQEMYRVLKHDSFCVCFCGWTQVEKFIEAWQAAGFRRVAHLVFTKRYASNTAGMVDYHHEQAFLLAKGHPRRPAYRIPDVMSFPYTGNTRHPTQKPIEILKPLILAFSQPDSLILDPFCGSASSCVAARLLGRQYLGIELNEKCYEQATKRMEALEQKLEARSEERAGVNRGVLVHLPESTRSAGQTKTLFSHEPIRQHELGPNHRYRGGGMPKRAYGS